PAEPGRDPCGFGSHRGHRRSLNRALQGDAMNGSRRLRALGHRNFRLFMFGQGVSLIGTWMQQVAIGWVVLQLTHSPLWLGIVAFAGQIPALLLAPVAG